MNDPVKKSVQIPPLSHKILEELSSHPLKMQMFFYLTSFGELSLTELSKLLKRPKTTVHHHTKKLEEDGILIARDQKKQNWVEKYYKLKEHIGSKDVEISLKKDIPLENLRSSLSAIGTFCYSIINQFSLYIAENYNEYKKQEKLGALASITLIDKKEAQKYIEQLQKIQDSLEHDNNEIETPPEDLWGIITVAVPYGKIFEDIMRKKMKKSEDRE